MFSFRFRPTSPEFTQFEWTLFLWAGWHVVGPSDPGPYTFGVVTPKSMSGWIGSYVGVDTTNPADPIVAEASTSGTSHSTTALSTANPYEMLIGAFQVQADAAWTAPADMLEVGEINNTTSSPFFTLGIDHAVQSRAASTVKTATSSASGSGTNMLFALNPLATNTTTLGSTTVSISSPSGPTLVSTGAIALASTAFVTGDHLILDVAVADDPNNCPAVRISYDSTGQPSKLTIASIVPEGVAGLALLAPAVPLAWRWRKRGRR